MSGNVLPLIHRGFRKAEICRRFGQGEDFTRHHLFSEDHRIINPLCATRAKQLAGCSLPFVPDRFARGLVFFSEAMELHQLLTARGTEQGIQSDGKERSLAANARADAAWSLQIQHQHDRQDGIQGPHFPMEGPLALPRLPDEAGSGLCEQD